MDESPRVRPKRIIPERDNYGTCPFQMKIAPNKKPPASSQNRNQRYRNKLKKDPVKYEAYKAAHRERARQNRSRPVSEDKKQLNREMQRIRQQRYRERKREAEASGQVTVKVKKISAEQRERNRLSAIKMRQNYSKEKLASVRRKRRDRYWSQKLSTMITATEPGNSSVPGAENILQTNNLPAKNDTVVVEDNGPVPQLLILNEAFLHSQIQILDSNNMKTTAVKQEDIKQHSSFGIKTEIDDLDVQTCEKNLGTQRNETESNLRYNSYQTTQHNELDILTVTNGFVSNNTEDSLVTSDCSHIKVEIDGEDDLLSTMSCPIKSEKEPNQETSTDCFEIKMDRDEEVDIPFTNVCPATGVDDRCSEFFTSKQENLQNCDIPSGSNRDETIELEEHFDAESFPSRREQCPQKYLQEKNWFEAPFLRPKDVPAPCKKSDIISYQRLIWENPPEMFIRKYANTVSEMAILCGQGRDGWLMSSHIHWVLEQTNKTSTNSVCICVPTMSTKYVQEICGSRSSLSRLIFVVNVGKETDDSVFIASTKKLGNHWVLVVTELENETVLYCDSLGWSIPSLLLETLSVFVRNFNIPFFERAKVIPLHVLSTRGSGHYCSSSMCKNYPLQSCTDVCGIVAVSCYIFFSFLFFR